MKNVSYEYLVEKNNELENKLQHYNTYLNTEIVKSFKSVFVSLPTINYLLDPEEATIIEVNNSAIDFYGYNADEMCGQTIDLINIKPLDEIKKILKQTAINKQGKIEIKHKLKSGKIKDIEVLYSKIEIDKRHYLYCTIYDITEKNRTNEIIKNERNKFKLIAEQALSGIALSDFDGNYIFVNEAFCKMVNYTETELLSMKVFDLMQSYDKSKYDKLISLREVKLRKKLLKIKNGSQIHININAKIVNFDNKGMVLGIIDNINEQVIAEQKLNEEIARTIESESRYKNIIECTSDFIWTVDANEFKLQSFNSSLSKFYKKTYNIDIKIGDNAHDIIKDKALEWDTYYKKTLEDGIIILNMNRPIRASYYTFRCIKF